jgi:hypothetical protein
MLTVIVGAPVALLLSWPQAVSAERLPGIAQLISFRAGLAIALLVVGLVFAVVARARRRWSAAAALAVLLVAASAANAGIVLARSGVGTQSGNAGRGTDELTVVAWNTLGGAASPQSIARLVIDTDADIVSLPETDETAVAEVARLVALEGKAMTADTTRGADGDSDIPTSVLIADELGDYRMDEDAGSTPGLPSGVWEPVDGTGPRIVAAHPLPRDRRRPQRHRRSPWNGARRMPGCRARDRRRRRGHLACGRSTLARRAHRPRPDRLGMGGARLDGDHRCDRQRSSPDRRRDQSRSSVSSNQRSSSCSISACVSAIAFILSAMPS